MAAPTPGTRLEPIGERLKRGYRILINIQGDENINFWEMTVKPPGLDGGPPIDTTTQWNDVYRTMVPEALVTMTDMTFKAAYDPEVYDSVVATINKERIITVPFPDTSSICFYGFLQKFEPSDASEKEMPTSSVTITPTNQDPNTGDEEPPVYTPPTGT